ncbi:uncharacterized protein MELLADRAFT_90077 [Melampsora larici-populina 98AG31]|uniref:Uncharacterized protein n=1 Tax=Melampsora larici-populina (strain 98AG31 / pathotype 3-4-7) TaxID=747676 RepID=F4RVL7_MELLP|nr:uncharacterized protein MELLADRAFT_90077 [Melampsora larici-populina 98AG31]EGG03647.1 hypothetical protein MELLADRAFT_90077 [Melampsora larici-populina 98AG31]
MFPSILYYSLLPGAINVSNTVKLRNPMRNLQSTRVSFEICQSTQVKPNTLCLYKVTPAAQEDVTSQTTLDTHS